MEKKTNIVEGYKAYKKGFICEPVVGKPFQYRIGETYHCEEEVIPCHSGFHFCPQPFSVFHYYPLIDRYGDLSVFSKISATGNIVTFDKDKYCCSDITIGEELSFFELCQKEMEDLSKKGISFNRLFIINKDDEIEDSFYLNYLTLSIFKSCAVKIHGDDNKIAIKSATDVFSCGDGAQILVDGAYCKIETRGFDSRICSLKDHNFLNLRGENSVVKSLGERSHIYSTGNYNIIRSFGNDSYIQVTGDTSLIDSQGNFGYIRCLGKYCQIRAKAGTLIEWAYQKSNGELAIKRIVVDGKNMKEDKFYLFIRGELTETALEI